jgi:hypothetical protein
MPFAPFIGINRHGQSIMLGCGFLRQDLAVSYDWLFDSFLIAMGGLAPEKIIIDQDVAMKKSIDAKFPTSVHRNCRWHIMQKAQLKCVVIMGRNASLAEDFNECIDFTFSLEDFEAKWALFVAKWALFVAKWLAAIAGHTYFTTMYEHHAQWVSYNFKHHFFPFLQSTQCSEGFNAVLKRYVNPHKSLLNLLSNMRRFRCMSL